jgi:uncharacterized protein (TIGR02246 family)
VDLSFAKDSLQPTIDALNAAWNRADGEAFAARCAPDVDFINLLGMYVKGRTAVVGMHGIIFKGPYAGSTLKFSIEHVRVLSPNVIVAIVPGELHVPAGPVKGLIRTVATMVFERDGTNWYVASFQNTKREASQADLTKIMADAFAKGS